MKNMVLCLQDYLNLLVLQSFLGTYFMQTHTFFRKFLIFCIQFSSLFNTIISFWPRHNHPHHSAKVLSELPESKNIRSDILTKFQDGHSVGSVMEIIEAECSSGNSKQKTYARSEILRRANSFFFKLLRRHSTHNKICQFTQHIIDLNSITLSHPTLTPDWKTNNLQTPVMPVAHT